jgi:cell division inhibitor SepF
VRAESELLAMIQEIRADNLDALGRPEEAERVRSETLVPAAEPVETPATKTTLGAGASVTMPSTPKSTGWHAPQFELAEDELPNTTTIWLTLDPVKHPLFRTNRWFGRRHHPETPRPTQVVSLNPTEYREVTLIAEYLRTGSPVIVNLSQLGRSERQRMIDFVTGLAAGQGARIEPVAKNAYLIKEAPAFVTHERPRDRVHWIDPLMMVADPPKSEEPSTSPTPTTRQPRP